MYLVDLENKGIKLIKKCDFSSAGIRERQDIEEWIEKTPDILGEQILIIQKEFDGFDETKERLDLLGLDIEGNLVIIEIKRDDSGSDVNWQSIKYAAYCSTLTKDDIVDIYSQYLMKINTELKNPKSEAMSKMSDFLEDDVENIGFNNNQRIILVSKEFRKEVLSAVMWLLDNNIDIKCVKIQPFEDSEVKRLYLVPTVVLPTPNTEDYRIKRTIVIKEQEIQKGREYGILSVKIDNKEFSNVSVRTLFKDVLVYLVDNGHMSKISESWGTGTKRYIVSNEENPTHPNGRDFFVPVGYGGYTLESHCSRKKAMKILDDLCQKLDLKYERISF